MTSVTLTGIQNHDGATISNDRGPDVTSGEATVGPWAGESVINIDLTAEDGATTKRYTVTAERILTVNFDAAAYSVDEGESVQVSVSLDGVPGNEVRANLSTTLQGATTPDFGGVPEYVTFAGTDAVATFDFVARTDIPSDPGESVTIGLSPNSQFPGLQTGSTDETVVSIGDIVTDQLVAVDFGQSTYSVNEGASVPITITLATAPSSSVTIPLTITAEGDAISPDYSVPSSVTFDSGDTSQTITFSATLDADTDPGESVKIELGRLPMGYAAGATTETRVSINNFSVVVNFSAASYDVAEDGEVQISVTLSPALGSDVAIGIMAVGRDGATTADYSLPDPASVTITAGQTQQTFTFTSKMDDVDDDDERVIIGFDALPAGVYVGTTAPTTVINIADNDHPQISLGFENDTYTVIEGGSIGLKMKLSGEPERGLTITVRANLVVDNPASGNDFSGIPSDVHFAADATEAILTFAATYDSIDEDDEYVKLEPDLRLPGGVGLGTNFFAIVTIIDNDGPGVSISESSLTIAEGSTDTYTVALNSQPMGDVTVTIAGAGTDLSLDNTTLTFTTTTWASAQTVTVTAVDDEIDDDGETVTLTHTVASADDSDYQGISAGSVAVSITDNDDPQVSVSFEQATYTVSEGSSETIKVKLDKDPERTVTIPINKANQDGATSADYSGVPENVTFNSGDTEKTFSLAASTDSDNDDGESVKLTFGALPTGVSEGTTNEATVSINNLQGTIVRETIPPTLLVATVDGTSMALIYSEVLDTGSVPAPSAYSVVVAGATGVAPSSVAVTGAKVKLTLSTAATSSDTVTVTYTQPGTNPLRDLAGNDAAALSTRAVTNNTGSTNNQPAFSSDAVTRSVAENTANGTAFGSAVTATDGDSDMLTYSLPSGFFTFAIADNTGQLLTLHALNHEDTSSYLVPVYVSDDKDAAGGVDAAIDDTIAVTITVTNVNEPGTVAITGTLSGGSALTASVTNDPDGAVSSVTWQWARGSTQGGSFSNISGATNASYTTTAADVGEFLQATASYTDPEGSGKTASAVTTSAIGASNSAPTFSSSTATRTVQENSSAGTNVGDVVVASDSDSDILTYSLSGTDANDFSIVSTSGQIQTRSGVTYNFEAAKNSYSVTVTVHDGKDAAGGTDTSTIDDTIAVTITVTNVNEPGTVAITGTLSGGEELTASVTDIDGAVSSETWRWARGGTQGGSFSNISGATNASYTTVAADVGEFLQATAAYTDAQGPNKSASAVTTSAIGASNDEPEFSAGTATRTLPENSGAGVNVAGGTITAADNDNDTLTYSLASGGDNASFEIDSSGQIKTKTGGTHNFNFEATKNSYTVTMRVSDGKDAAGNTEMTAQVDDTIAVTINLTNVNEAPTFMFLPPSTSVPENSTTVHTFAASDVDASDTLEWSVESADDGSFFEINSSGQLSFKTAPNFEIKQDADIDNVYEVTVKVADAGGLNATHEFTVTVTNVNEAPTIGSGPNNDATVSKDENTATTEIIATYEASDVDAGANLTWSLEGADAGDFTLIKNSMTGNGELKFMNVPNYEAPADAGVNNDYEVTIKVADGSLSATRNLTVTVEDVNETPNITTTQTAISVEENQTDVLTYAASDVDNNGESDDSSNTLTWTVETADDGNFFEVNSSTGVLTFKAAPDFENKQDAGANNVYDVTVTVTDNGIDGGRGSADHLSVSKSLAVTVTDVNETPTITSGPATITKDENTATAEIIATYVATDPDATTGTMSWDLQGNDSGDFRIESPVQGTANLYFAASPDFENATDTDTDNVYDVTVRVRDNGSPRLQDTRTVEVTVEDVNETPVVSGNGSPSFPEIQFDVGGSTLTTANLTVPGDYTFTDEEGDDVTWSLSGTDANHFTITGKPDGSAYLEFKNPSPGTTVKPANYEIPLDDGSGNTYVIIVQATDNNAQGGKTGTKTGTFAVTVNVTNVDETPEITTTDPSHTAPSFPEIEYDATTADLIVADYDARDEEAENITWSLTGNDAGDFTIDSNGVLTFRNRPDFEMPTDRGADPPNPDNVYEIVVKATDATPDANTRELGVTVTVTDVNERPDIDEDTVPSYVEVEYDFTGTRPDIHTFTATDYDDMDTFSWSLEGVDKDHLEIDSMNGVLTFKQDANFDRGPLPNFEHPRDDNADGSANTYNITVRATDNHAKSTDYLVTINVTNVNETPEFTGTPETTITLDEHDANETYVSMVVADYDARDEEAGVTWLLTGTDSGDFNIDSNGVLTFAATPNFESPADSTPDNVYEFTVVATDVESGSTRRNVTQAVTVTVEDVEEAGAITVSNSNPGVGDVIRFELTDPDGEIDLTPPTPGNPPPINWEIQTRTPGGAWLGINAGNPLATFAQYQALEDHTGREVRAVVTYIDPRGPGKSAESEATAAITADPIINAPPRFEGGGSQSIPEGEAGRFLDERLTATDRDGDNLTFGLGDGVNSHLFEVNASTGQIRAVEALDFETAPSSGYLTVPITLHDGMDADGNVESPPVIDDTGTLSVYITDVEEDGVVTLSQEEPEVGVALRASLTDGDGSVSGTSWQWARSENGRTGWTNISGATSSSYTPEDDDGDFYLRARVSYTDRRPGGKSADAVTGSPVPSENQPPTFPATEDGQRTIAENTPASANIGAPVAADDPENDALTYSLTGTDAAAFTIVETTGQLRLAQNVTLDYEGKRTHRFTVQVTDGRDEIGDDDMDAIDDTIAVTVTVTNVNEAPEVTGDDSPSFQENANSAVATYRATDPERDTLTWSVSGNDFWISSRGQLYFRSPPSFEEQTTYSVTVTATDDDEDNALSGSLSVTITVTDAEEEGTITIEPPRGWDGTTFTAALDDDDGGITGETWQWERSSNQSSWEDISGATSITYTASADDVGQFLRATVSYEDSRGSGKETSAAVKGRIEDSTDRPTSNNAPAFTESAPERSVGQGTATGRNVGAPVRATDEDTGDVLTYSLGGTDAPLFDINPATGQILTKAVLDYDPDGTNSYSVEVRVLDGFGPDYLSTDVEVDATITVTISVTQARRTSTGGGSSSGSGGGGGGGSANRPPEITGPKNLQYPENSAEPVATYEAEDPEGTAIRWEIEDTDEEHFRISEDGVLSFKKPPDYENPVDFRLNNTYEIRLLAFDSGIPRASGRLQVRIEIKDVDLPGVPEGYDANDDEMITLEEAIVALAAFSEGVITREEATAIIKLYFSNPTHGNEGDTP